MTPEATYPRGSAHPYYPRRIVRTVSKMLDRDPIRRAQIMLTALFVVSVLVIVYMTVEWDRSGVYVVALIVVLQPFVFVLIGTILKKSVRDPELHKLFVSKVAHELRGPMSVMQLESEIALMDTVSGDRTRISVSKSKELVRAVQGEMKGLLQMSEIIKNLSLLTSIGYTSERPAFTVVELSALLRQVCDESRKRHAQAKNISILISIDPAVYVSGNESQLEMIIRNLLRNSINYSPEGSTIVASAKTDKDGHPELTIRDTGIGISSADLPHVFEAFFRAKHPTQRQEKGSGLGLAIVAAFARLHDAQIQIESVLNKGTAVTLRFPAVTHTS